MAQTPSTMLALGTPAPDFALADTDGSTVSRSDFAGKPLLVMFICNHCPFVIHVAPELARLAGDYGDKIGIVAIQPNDVANYPADAPDKMAEEKIKRHYTFPYLYDADQSVAKAYTAACTPDFFLFDADHKLAYRGQLDSTRPYRISSGNYDDRNGAAQGEDLRAALDALLSGQPVSEKQWPSIGCNIKWIPGNEPAYFG
ncbi:MAG: thioredoxin family protein [Planctomycetota bacterium]